MGFRSDKKSPWMNRALTSDVVKLEGDKIISNNTRKYDHQQRNEKGKMRKKKSIKLLPFKCDICSTSFKIKPSLRRHILTKHSECTSILMDYLDRTPCSICGLLLHTRDDCPQKEKPFQCHDCSRNFRQKKFLVKHMVIHSYETNVNPKGEKTNCNLCGVYHHRRRDCPKVDLPFKCAICSRSFKVKRYLNRHMVVHSDKRPYPCNLCDLSFRRSWELKNHDRVIHQGMKAKQYHSYQCNHCPKAFTNQRALSDHQYVHTGIKNYPCEICGKMMTRLRNLIVHQQMVHEPKPDMSTAQSYVCHVCGTLFYNKKYHSKHVRTAHGDTRPKCKICGKIVNSQKALLACTRSHSTVDASNNNTCCKYCGQTCESENALNIHLQTHHHMMMESHHTGGSAAACDLTNREIS